MPICEMHNLYHVSGLMVFFCFSIKQRTTLLHRGLSYRSVAVKSECLKMLKDEWLVNNCGGDVIALLRLLDVETYESVGESVMGVLLKDGAMRVQDGQTIRQYFTANTEDNGKSQENHMPFIVFAYLC